MRIEGAVEHVSRIGVRGWVSAPGVSGPMQVVIMVQGVEEARLPARLPRDDVRAAGLSADGRCGFEFLWQSALPEELHKSVRVLAGPERVELPHVSTGGPPSLYARLFDGSFGADTTIPETAFLSPHYTRHNARRLEHLASLRLPLQGRDVVEFGAGVGDHSSFYLDRGCQVLATDARSENLALLDRRLCHHPHYERLRTAVVNVERPFDLGRRFEVVHCYGLLYHLADPGAALERMAASCASLFLLETKTDPGGTETVMTGRENSAEPYHSFSGHNARPTRAWIERELRHHFDHVFFPKTTPAHEEFPTDWADLSSVPDGWPRTVVVASREPLRSDWLQASIPMSLAPA